jgi:GTPase
MIENIFNKYNIPLSLLDIPSYTIPKQPKEKYYGNREYKMKIIDLCPKKLEKRATQCLFRIYEGSGKAEYFIGVADNGNIIGLTYEELCLSIENFIKIVNNAGVNIYKIKIYRNYDSMSNSETSNNNINLSNINLSNYNNFTIQNKVKVKPTYYAFIKLRKTNIEF